MKQGWEIKTLGQLSKNKDAVVSGPFGSNLKVSDYKEEGIPILRLQNIGKGQFIDKSIKYITEEKAEELKYHSFISGDIALAKLGIPIGKTCIIPNHFTSGVITADIVRIRPDIKIVDYKYLEYFLNTDFSVKQLTGNISGATRPRVNLSDVRNIEIPLPPVPEQQRIVAILDEAFAAIAKAKANAEQNLKNAKELFDSYLQSVFENRGEGWEEKTLGEVVDNIITGPFGSMLHKSDYVEDGIPVVNPQNIVDGQIISLQKTMINKVTFNRLEKYALKYGDIVIARRGEMGRCAIVKNENVGWLCGTGSFVIRVNKKKADSEFLNIFLSSAEVKNQLEKLSIGATMNNLNQSILSELLLNVPPVAEQQTIVQKLDALSGQTKKLEAIYQQHINDLEELKKSVLQKAFNGELHNPQRDSTITKPQRGGIC